MRMPMASPTPMPILTAESFEGDDCAVAVAASAAFVAVAEGIEVPVVAVV